MTTERRLTDSLSRRTALTGVATVGLGIPFLAACGGADESASDTGADSSGSTPEAATSDAPADGADGADGADAPAGGSGSAEPLASTGDIKVGGGKIFDDVKAVVTQPSSGEFKCFTSICTHTGCPVTSVSDGTINCPCHGSKFSIEDGSVKSGPAPRPLAEKEIAVTGDQIALV